MPMANLSTDVALTFVQDAQGLAVTPSAPVRPLPGIVNERLAAGTRVLRITHSKDSFNDDGPTAVAAGRVRRSNLGTGDFNNDLTMSDTPGGAWSASFSGTSISVVAPKEPGAGAIDIQIDGRSPTMADLFSVAPARPSK
jgi:hypothetical protein